MAWSTPMTAVINEVWTHDDFNTHVRDNLNELLVAKATQAGQHFVATAPNQLVAREPAFDEVNVLESTASAIFTDLDTPGPAVTVETGDIALVGIAARVSNTGAGSQSHMVVEVTGDSTILADGTTAFGQGGAPAGALLRGGRTFLMTGLTPGTNTFTLKYRSGGSTSSFTHRHIFVVPL